MKANYRDNPPSRYDLKNSIMKLENIRDRALLSILYLSAVRVEELVYYKKSRKVLGLPIKKGQIEKRDNYFLINNVRILKCRNPNLRKNIPIVYNQMEEFFIKVFWDYADTLTDAEYLFPITRQRVHQILKPLGYFPHLLRHSRCCHLIVDYDFNMAQLQAFIGWRNLSSAGSYLHLRTRDLINKMTSM